MAESKKVKSGDVKTQKMSRESQEKPQKPPQIRAITMMLVAVLVLQVFLVSLVLLGIWVLAYTDWVVEHLHNIACEHGTWPVQWLFEEDCP